MRNAKKYFHELKYIIKCFSNFIILDICPFKTDSTWESDLECIFQVFPREQIKSDEILQKDCLKRDWQRFIANNKIWRLKLKP